MNALKYVITERDGGIYFIIQNIMWLIYIIGQPAWSPLFTDEIFCCYDKRMHPSAICLNISMTRAATCHKLLTHDFGISVDTYTHKMFGKFQDKNKWLTLITVFGYPLNDFPKSEQHSIHMHCPNSSLIWTALYVCARHHFAP